MRLFPDDDVPGLTVSAPEMPSPWLMPRGLSRRHRDRLGALVARAVHRFDPRIRCVQLRWAEAPYVREGRIKLPERALVWWRSDTIAERARDVLQEAPKVAPALHLLDLDGDPGVEAFGWLAPIKAELAHRLTDALLEGPVATDPEPLIDAINEAAERLVSPIDLLDFADRLIQTRASGSSLEDARADAIALVLVERMAAGPMAPSDAVERAGALERAAQPGPLPPEAHAFLLGVGLAEKDPAARPPLLGWAGAPGVAARIAYRLRLHPMVLQPAGEAKGTAPTTAETEPPEKRRAVEDQAARVLESVRNGEERSWPVPRRRAAAAVLEAFVQQSARSRDNKFVVSLYEREVAVLEVVARLWEDVAEPERALAAWVGVAEHCLLVSQVPRAQAAAERARTLVERSRNPSLQAWFFITAANISKQSANFPEAKQGYDTALSRYRAAGYHLGEANTLNEIGDLAVRTGDLAEARQTYGAAKDLYRAASNPRGEAHTLRRIGDLAVRTADLAEAKQAYDAALSLYRAIGDRLGEANALNKIGDLALRTDDLATAQQTYDATMSLYRTIGNRQGEANTLRSIGALALQIADLADAKHAYDAALSLYRTVGDRIGEANTLWSIGNLAVHTADVAGAKRALDAALTLYHTLGERLGEANALRGLGLVALLEGRDATETLRASETLAAAVQNRSGALLSRTFLAAVGPAPTAAGELDTLATSFSSLAFPQAASLARALARLRAGDTTSAARLLLEQPETATIAAAVARASPDDAVRLLLPFIPTA